MKKGLLTVLLASLVLVGCQNYDDQFDDLNAQISALKSQVDGLASLTSQVSSLQGTLSGLQSGIAAAQAAASAAGSSADAATAAATAAGTTATANATAIAAATAAATAAGASADAATAAATAATDAATAAITEAAAATAAGTAAGTAATAAGVTATANAAAIAAATAAATAAGVSADAATAAAEAATAAATSAIAEATAAATAAAEATTAATTAGTDAVAAAALAAAAATTAGEDATAAAAAAEAAATAAGASAVDAAALATAAATAATTAAEAATAAAGANTTSLTALAAEVDAVAAALAAVQASLATVSTAEEVAALQTEIDAIEEDLTELLNSSNVYQDDVIITNNTQLDTFFDLGSAINIVNGDIDINNASALDAAKLAVVMSKIITVNGAYAYDGIADTATPAFSSLVSAGNITITEAYGAVNFPVLTTGGVVSITEQTDADGDGEVTSLSMPVLTSVTSFNVGGNGKIDLVDAGTSVNLNSLPRVGTTSALTVNVATGGEFVFGALASTDADGDEIDSYNLTLAGMASVTIPTSITGLNGTLAVSDVASLTVNGWDGTVDVNADVTTFELNDVYAVALDGAVDTTTAAIDMTFGSADNTTAYATAAIAAAAKAAEGDGLSSVTIPAAMAELTSATVSGNLLDLTVTNSPDLVSLTITATMDDLIITGSDKLETLTVSDASMKNITLDDNDDIDSIVLDHTVNLAYTGSEDAATTTTLIVKDSADVESLTYSGASVSTLTVTDNTVLGAIDFSGLETVGASAKVTISGNDLNAASVTATSASAGSYDSGTSGMDTLETFLDLVTAQTAATADVQFDSASTVTEADDTESNSVLAADSDDAAALLHVLTKTAGTSGTAPGTQVSVFAVEAGAGDNLAFTLNGVEVDFGAMAGNGTAATKAADVATILASAAVDTALAAGAIVGAERGYNSSSSIIITTLAAGGSTLYGERYNTTAAVTGASTSTGGVYGIGKHDLFELTVGTESITVSLTVDSSDSADVVNALITGWAASTNELYSLSSTLADRITISVVQKDAATYNETVEFAITDVAYTTSILGTTATSDAVDYIIGSTRLTTDNATVDSGILVTFTSNAAGATNNTIATLVSSSASNTVTAVAELDTNTAAATAAIASDEVAADTGNDTDRTSWL